MIRFPWPDPKLSPNKRAHRLHLTNIRQTAREIGFYLTKDSKLQIPENGDLQLKILICPPDHRARDDDNIYSSFKSYRDGIFQALDTNDKRIRRTVLEWGQAEKDGALYVTLEAIENK